ncbi:addiction module protein [Flavobacterium eburneipallidum]|uniref:addiction module protein n=1 Tax=Flavobacterium eburneipallidum TaxID=3003263 RepID=UPI0024825B30|nr:addiction module protein [Flavobacterium eburneipallidum]
MNLKFIHDNKGNKTGVFIPIEEWQTLKTKYSDLQNEEVENNIELTSWQKEILDERLDDYYKNPSDVVDFDTTIASIRKKI